MRIAINARATSGPWGGGNQFVQLLTAYLRGRGHSVSKRLWPWTDAILLIAPKPFQNVTFDVDDIRRFKQRHPSVKCVHRVNQTNAGRGTTNVDDALARANDVADATIFISNWVRDYCIERWFRFDRPHAVIHNGADDQIFFPDDRAHDVSDLCRVVTHHWSTNLNKGFGWYQEVDRLIAEGQLPGFSLSVIGRWPDGMTWRAAKTVPPIAGAALAGALREHDLYLTAAVAEAGGMHHIEGAQCGLPLVYHANGGGIGELGAQYGEVFNTDIVNALQHAKANYVDLRARLMAHRPSGLQMCRAYESWLCA